MNNVQLASILASSHGPDLDLVTVSGVSINSGCIVIIININMKNLSLYFLLLVFWFWSLIFRSFVSP